MNEPEGDILVFLTGEEEIEKVCSRGELVLYLSFVCKRLDSLCVIPFLCSARRRGQSGQQLWADGGVSIVLSPDTGYVFSLSVVEGETEKSEWF